MGNDQLDAQTSARLLKRALAIKGTREALADTLGVHPHDLALWLAGRAFPPEPIFEKVLDIILDEKKPADPAQPATEARKRVLIAESAEGFQALGKILGNEFTLVPVHTLTDGLDLLQNSAVATHQGIDAIVCGQHFEGSQMLRFLECVKAYKATSAIPFICCRATSTQLRDGALAAMREACEALGAVAYIDLPERERDAGLERAAVEFRDAVRAAVRLPAARQPLRILVVDDNADAAHTLTALLRIAGHETFKAASGAEALRLGAQAKPDAALLDIGMQGMSGYVLAQKIREQPWGAATTLIAVTGRAGPEDVARAREAGFDHHFAKPVALERLLEALAAKRNRA
ncbi:MAG TPA: response regulator [Burkholderiales bacterium]|nr:response regulator [Burkholderiales bacterium]